ALGKHGQMDWMLDMVDERLDPARLLEGARTLLLVADQYARQGDADLDDQRTHRGRIAKYARGRDYHEVMRKRLGMLADRLRAMHPGSRFRMFVDTGPVLEREHAARAGLGFIGKNTMLINPTVGSYLVLGGLITTLELSESAELSDPSSHCGGCTRCIDACPTGAITPFSVDARKCISYLTIEHEGPIDTSLHEAMGNWVFGCDICQDVCPFNAPHDGRGPSPVNSVYRPKDALREGSIDLLELIGWTTLERQTRFGVSAGKRASLSMLRRNAVIAAGNHLSQHESPELIEPLRELLADSDPTVSQTALETTARISGCSGGGT
ncbi:MAG: tRNA epoxyqueuosine(34) reductase QueG, partial [Phycisphaerales bacterium]